jgi:hypothetical protein
MLVGPIKGSVRVYDWLIEKQAKTAQTAYISRQPAGNSSVATPFDAIVVASDSAFRYLEIELFKGKSLRNQACT